MRQVKNIVIGFGKAGKTLAKTLASKNEEVVIIEESEQMYGGTCINVGCIPSKSLIENAKKGYTFEEAVVIKEGLTTKLRNKNFHMVADEATAEVMNGQATFVSNKVIQVTLPNGEVEELEGKRIFINTGATSVIPSIPGAVLSERIVTSKEIMNLSQLPKSLTIIGGGYIGLEFASMFAKYGSKVTVLDSKEVFLPREESEVSDLIWEDLKQLGVNIKLKTSISEIKEMKDFVEVSFEEESGSNKKIQSDVVLLATGRVPNINNLGLENTEIELNSRKGIQVDDQLKTTVPNVWAMGDVTGGLQFTYVSLDDFRIISDQLFGMNQRRVSDRKVVPYTVFINPPLSRVGLTEKEAAASGLNYHAYKLLTAGVPKANVLQSPQGMFKIIVNKDNHEILGATIYAEASHEIINLVTLAMTAHLPFEMLRDQLYTHPTMAEALNDVLK